MWQQQRILIVHLRQHGEQEARRAALQIGAVDGVAAVDVFDWNLRARNMPPAGEAVPDYEAKRSETASKRAQGRPRPKDEGPQ